MALGQNDPMANVRKGLTRIYVVVVVLWELACLGLFLILSSGESAALSQKNYPALLQYMVVPPLVIYLLGFIAVPWIIKGFK